MKMYEEMISGTLTQIYKKIEERGPHGVRKRELIKEFGKDSDKQLEELLSQGMIYSRKVRNSTIYFTKDNYNNKENKISKTKSEDLLNEFRDMISLQNSKIDSLFNTLEERIRDVYDNINIINNKLNNNSLTNILDSITALKNSDTSLLTRVDTIEENMKISKDHDNSIQSEIDNLYNKIEGLTNKADIDNIKVLENRLDDNTKMIGNLDNNISKANDTINNILNTLNKIEESKIVPDREHNTRLSNLESTIVKLSEKINEIRGEVNKSISSIYSELENIKNEREDVLSLEQFKMEFDRVIAECSNSIGWIELAEIRKKISAKYKISKNTFYSLLAALLDTSIDSYELSSGGKEGVVIRGLVHGFVRMI